MLLVLRVYFSFTSRPSFSLHTCIGGRPCLFNSRIRVRAECQKPTHSANKSSSFASSEISHPRTYTHFISRSLLYFYTRKNEQFAVSSPSSVWTTKTKYFLVCVYFGIKRVCCRLVETPCAAGDMSLSAFHPAVPFTTLPSDEWCFSCTLSYASTCAMENPKLWGFSSICAHTTRPRITFLTFSIAHHCNIYIYIYNTVP